MDIESNGKYIFQTKPSTKQLRDKGHDTGSNFKPRDLDDLQDEPTDPTSIVSSSPRSSSIVVAEPTTMQTRDLDDVLGHNKVKFNFSFGGIGKMFEAGVEFATEIIEEFVKMIKKIAKTVTGQRKYPKLKYD